MLIDASTSFVVHAYYALGQGYGLDSTTWPSGSIANSGVVVEATRFATTAYSRTRPG